MKMDRRTFLKSLAIGTAASLLAPGELIAKIPITEIRNNQVSWIADADWGTITHIGIFDDETLIALTSVDAPKWISKSDSVTTDFNLKFKEFDIEFEDFYHNKEYSVGLFREFGEEVSSNGYSRKLI